MIPISKNEPDMASVHKFWYFLLVTYSFSLKILIFGLNFTYEIFRKVMAWASPRHCTWSVLKRGSLLGNEETHLGGDSPIFEIIYGNLEQRSIFAKKSTLYYVRINILVVQWVQTSKNHYFEWFFPLYCF